METNRLRQRWLLWMAIAGVFFVLMACVSAPQASPSQDSENAPVMAVGGGPSVEEENTGGSQPISGAATKTSQPTMVSSAQQKSISDFFVDAPTVVFRGAAVLPENSVIGDFQYIGRGGECVLIHVQDGKRFAPLTPLAIAPIGEQPDILDYRIVAENGAEVASGRVHLEDFDGTFSAGCEHLPDTVISHVGQYTLELISQKEQAFKIDNIVYPGRATLTFTIAMPASTSIMVEYASQRQVKRVYLWRFQPGEKVIVHVQKGGMHVAETFSVDSQGRLVVEMNNAASEPVIEGVESGIFFAGLPSVVIYARAWRPFSDCPESRLTKGAQTMVSYSSPLCNRIRQGAGTQYAVVDCIDPGGMLSILDGPQCQDGWVWWKVRTEDGVIGWTAEGDGVEFWLDAAEVPYTHVYYGKR